MWVYIILRHWNRINRKVKSIGKVHIFLIKPSVRSTKRVVLWHEWSNKKKTVSSTSSSPHQKISTYLKPMKKAISHLPGLRWWNTTTKTISASKIPICSFKILMRLRGPVRSLTLLRRRRWRCLPLWRLALPLQRRIRRSTGKSRSRNYGSSETECWWKVPECSLIVFRGGLRSREKRSSGCRCRVHYDSCIGCGCGWVYESFVQHDYVEDECGDKCC